MHSDKKKISNIKYYKKYIINNTAEKKQDTKHNIHTLKYYKEK